MKIPCWVELVYRDDYGDEPTHFKIRPLWYIELRRKWREWRWRHHPPVEVEQNIRVVDMDELIKDLDPDTTTFTKFLEKIKDERGGEIEW